MIFFRLLLNGGTLLLVAGIFLTVYNTLLMIIEIAVKTWRSIFVTWAGRRLREMGVLQESPYQTKQALDWKRLALVIGMPGFALAVHDFMLSPLVLIIGISILAWINFQQKQSERAQINEDAEAVALQMRSLMSVDHSLLHALMQVNLPRGVMKRVIEQVSSRLRMQQPPNQAAQALSGLPGTVTSRLAALIMHSAQLTDEIQNELLVSLEQETHRQKLLRSKTRQTLSLVRGTIRLLQGVVAATVSFVMLSPAWRDFFLQDISHRALLAVMICGIVLASLYFEFEVDQLSYGESA
ncbi:MAG: hypothetical protein JEZ00_11215 [Anaerolineaceae bacterium]|nr:hypothetical protein [Anaerolineaceae bacterium]